MPDHDAAQNDLELISDVATEAGRIAMTYFRKDPQVWYKDGSSPVTEADIAVNDFLRDRLRKARPDYGWLSEETETWRSQKVIGSKTLNRVDQIQ